MKTKSEQQTVQVTIEQLRRQLREDPENFEQALQQLIATCTDPDTIRFWMAMKEFARRPSDE